MSNAERPGQNAIPRGALLIILFEFFERFGFYSMLSLLALFLTGDRAGGGFGWDQTDALMLLGIYTGLMYALPVFGGIAADRVFGHQRAIAIGGSVMLIGYLLLASPVIMPALVEASGGGDVSAQIRALQSPLGYWNLPSGVPSDLSQTYWLITIGFWSALLALVVGNALMKATLVIVLGDNFEGNSRRRESAYAYYYMGINVGGLLAGVSAGSVAVGYGWYAAFATSAIGMGIALVAYLALKRRLLLVPENKPTEQTRQHLEADAGERQRLVLLGFFSVLLLAYHIGAFQVFGTMSLFLENEVDRKAGTFLIPTQWFTSVNAAALILSAPLFALLWKRLGQRGREPDIVGKYALALFLGASGLLLFAWTASSTTVSKPTWVIPAIGIMIQAAGEVAAWTSTYGIIYRVAPRRMVAGAMGAFYAATLGLGGYLSGWLGQFAIPLGYSRYFLICGVVTLGVSALALIVRPRLLRMARLAGASLKV